MKRLSTYILMTMVAIACHIEPPHKPVARFTYAPEGGCVAPCTITFTSESENAEGLQWDFGDGSAPVNGNSVSHYFKDANTYKVKLIAKGIDGGSSGSTQAVHLDNVKPFSIRGGNNFPTDIVSDDEGNIYVSGTARGTVRFSNDLSITSKGGDDFFVAKYDSNGTCIWVYADGSAADDHGNAIALDKENNIYLTGFVGGKVTSTSAKYRGGRDGFVTKILPDGTCDWFETFGGPGNDQGRSLEFQQAGEGPKLYLIGRVEGNNQTKTVDFNEAGLVKANGDDGFFSMLEADNGVFEKLMMIWGNGQQIPETITTDVEGNAYIAGSYTESIEFEDGTKLNNINGTDVFVAKWNSIRKKFQWGRRVASGGDDFAYDIKLDGHQNIFVTGMHSGTFEEVKLGSKGDENVYLLKLDKDGNILNGRNGYIDDNKDYHGGIAVSPAGNIVIAGSFTNLARFPMTRGTSVAGSGGTDVIITEVDPKELDRTTDFIAKVGGVLEDRVNKICVTKSGFVYATGWFYGNVVYKNVQLKNEMQSVQNTFVVRFKL